MGSRRSKPKLRSWVHVRDGGIDLLRLFGALFVWNARKTSFRLGWRRRCPCQAPGDSGRAGETRCEASLLLERPARFRFVCPALRETPSGWRCHHDKAAVRPYWGRAFATFAALALLLWLFGATGWFAVLRLNGVGEAAWWDCIWPPRHERIGEARASHFRDRFQQAFDRGDIQAATVALHSAFISCPHCWQDGLLLAQLYERTGQFAAADHIFDLLEQRAPAAHEAMAIARHDALLHSRRYRSLAELAWRELSRFPARREAWLTPLVHALAADPLAASVLPPPEARTELSAAERMLLSLATEPAGPLPGPRRHHIMDTPVDGPGQAILRWRLLLDRGERLAALNAALTDAAQLGEFELGLARWATIDPRTPPAQAAQWWLDLFPSRLSSAHVERLCAVALRSPFPVPLSALRVAAPAGDRASLASLWVLAVRQGDTSLAEELLRDLGLLPRDGALPLDPAQLSSRLPIIATLLPIPRQVHYALMPSAAHESVAPGVDGILDLQE